MIRWPQSTIRTRLTVLYAGTFFAAGALLVALMYFYLRQELANSPGSSALAAAHDFLATHRIRNHPFVDDVVEVLSVQAEERRRELLDSVLAWSLGFLVVIGIVSAGCGWLLAGRALRPLQEVTAAARRVADRNLHERISLDGPADEIKELADTFNAMLERLDRAFDSQHRFVANASHELRTPLAINRTLIEVALEDPDVPDATRHLGATLLQVNRRHERLIGGLLMLATSEQGVSRPTPVDFAECGRRAADTAADMAQRHGVQITSEFQPAHVMGDQELLDRLAQNLVDNAIRYSPPEGGWARIAVWATDRTATLVIENNGAIIPAEAVDALFEPFRRLTPHERMADPGGGSGLGLSIVRAITAAHGGTASAAARAGGGLMVTVRIPTCEPTD
ncbi:ATP-binding protein [Mycobacterium sp. OTB74]|uniref:sensor histidine kinase n=1 Tax=Mycobacterium sp. OTB74 TaxID=1853452 RepID=UPI0024761B1D|nr:ATP-binding protein [Mycobacterium sp. OTB74]MDH6243984.1 signal transduction histidine kinase [Mycobacterium sp. OTB74]